MFNFEDNGSGKYRRGGSWFGVPFSIFVSSCFNSSYVCWLRLQGYVWLEVISKIPQSLFKKNEQMKRIGQLVSKNKNQIIIGGSSLNDNKMANQLVRLGSLKQRIKY